MISTVPSRREPIEAISIARAVNSSFGVSWADGQGMEFPPPDGKRGPAEGAVQAKLATTATRSSATPRMITPVPAYWMSRDERGRRGAVSEACDAPAEVGLPGEDTTYPMGDGSMGVSRAFV